MSDALFYIAACSLPCWGLALGIFIMVVLFALMSGGTWRKLRSQSRPLLWAFGLDWPEIRRTYARAFRLYYARHLPESVRPGSPSEVSPGDSLDESGDVPPGVSLPMNGQTERPSSDT